MDCVPIQSASAVEVSGGCRDSVMDAGAIVGIHGGSRVICVGEHIRAADFIPHFQGGKEYISTGIDLKKKQALGINSSLHYTLAH